MPKKPDHHDPRDQAEQNDGQEQALFEGVNPARLVGVGFHGRSRSALIERRTRANPQDFLAWSGGVAEVAGNKRCERRDGLARVGAVCSYEQLVAL